MDNKKQIFMLYSCDIWKNSYSMSLLCVSTSQFTIRSMIIKKIENGYMCYEDEDLLSEEQVELFKEDWETLTRQEINDNLICGYYDYTYDGEEI